MSQWIGIISSGLLIIIGLGKYFGRKAAVKRQLAEQARKDLDAAKKNDSPSDFLDGFGRMR